MIAMKLEFYWNGIEKGLRLKLNNQTKGSNIIIYLKIFQAL